MNEESQVDVYYLGVATGPTAEAQAAAPWATGGFVLILVAFTLCFAATAVLVVKRRVPGRWLILSGLTFVMIYFLFQNTLAQDAELRYGPVADALALVSYGLGGFAAALGYTRLVWHVCKERNES
jgi:hypothetical protein